MPCHKLALDQKMIMLRSKSNKLLRSMITEIIFIERAPSYLRPFALLSFVCGFGGTRGI